MSLHVGGRGPGHLVRTGAFYPAALAALDFQLQEYRTGSGSYYIRDLSALVGWSFTRASTKTALNSSGAVVSFASGVPAITDLGLLIEEARTNLLLWSQDISNASWTKTDIMVGASIAAPDGTITAALATAGSAGTDTLASNSGTIVASSTNTISIHLKKSGSQWLRLVFADATGTDGFNQWVDLTNGVLGTSTLRGSGTRTGASIKALLNGWYRVTLTGVASTRTSLGLSIVSASGDGSTTRVNGATYYPWGAGLEAGSFATSYILTTSAAATRAADVPSLSNGIALTTLPYSVSVDVGGVPDTVSFPGLQSVTGSSGLFITNSNLVQLFASVPGTLNTPNTITLGVPFKAAYGVDALGRSVVLNGGAVASDSGVQTNGATFYIGNDRGIGSFINGYLRRLVVYPSRLSNAQLQALTQ